jgi:hypothetical protein
VSFTIIVINKEGSKQILSDTCSFKCEMFPYAVNMIVPSCNICVYDIFVRNVTFAVLITAMEFGGWFSRIQELQKIEELTSKPCTPNYQVSNIKFDIINIFQCSDTCCDQGSYSDEFGL